MLNADMPAMPVLNGDNEPANMDFGYYMNSNLATGITKREMMAMHMMASMSGIYWEAEGMYDSGESLIKCQAESAVEMADALLAELGRTK